MMVVGCEEVVNLTRREIKLGGGFHFGVDHPTDPTETASKTRQNKKKTKNANNTD